MRPPSPSLIASLRLLHSRVETGSSQQISQSMHELEGHHHPAVALALMPLVISTYPTIAQWAARRIGSLVEHLDEGGLLWIAREGRQFFLDGSHWFQQWRDFRPTEVDRLERFGDASCALLGLGSMHASGYVRQACVDKLALYSGKYSFSFLLLRINDWVKPVRGMARLAILGRLHQAREGDLNRCQELLENVLLADYIESWGRDDHRPIQEAIHKTLMSDAFGNVMEQGFASRRFAIQGRMYQLALERDEDSLVPILLRAMSSRSGINRLWAARIATQKLTGDQLRQIVALMKNDSLAILRYEAVFALAAKLPPRDPNDLLPFLLDPGADVRFLAAYYLAESKFDVRAFYLNALEDPVGKNLAAIVAGIGEKGSSGDEVKVLPLLSHADPLVRAAAVHTVGKLGRQRDLGWLFTALRDPHKLVARTAAKQLTERMHLADASAIDDWFWAESRSSLQRLAVRLGARMQRWDALEFLLKAAHHSAPLVHRDVKIELERWSSSFVDWYTPPSPERLTRLRNVFAAARTAVPETILHWIGNRLDVYRSR